MKKLNKLQESKLRQIIREEFRAMFNEAEVQESPEVAELKKKIKGLKNIIAKPEFPADKKDAIKKMIQKLETSLTNAVLSSTSDEASKAKDSAKKDIKSEGRNKK